MVADELIIEFEKPGPFATSCSSEEAVHCPSSIVICRVPRRKRRRGNASSTRIRAMTPFKTELFVSRLWLTVTP